jgi:hypothetical protein
MHSRLSLLAVSTAFFTLLAIAAFLPGVGLAQQKSELAGDYAGVWGPYHVKLHLTVDSHGAITGKVDNTDARLYGLQCTDFQVNGKALRFTVPMVSGGWSGVVQGNGTSLVGTWSQGVIAVPLNLVRIGAASPGLAPGARQASATFPSSDFIQNGFRFHRVPGGGAVQVLDDNNGQIAGTIIFPPGAAPMFTAMPPYNSGKIKAAYDKHMNGGGQQSAPTQEAANVQPPGQVVNPAEARSGVAPSAAAGNEQGLQNYEGSLGSLGKPQILLPGDSIQTPTGTLKNENDSHRVLVYFPTTREKVSFSSGKSSHHKDDVVVLAGNFGAARASAAQAEVLARLAGGEAPPRYTEYLIHFTGGNSNLKHVFEGTLKAQTLDRAQPGASRLGTDSRAHMASFEISTVDAEGHVHESLSSRQVDDWMNTTAFSQGLLADPGDARAAGLAVVADRALEDQGKENPKLRNVKKHYGLGSAMLDDLSYLAFGAGGLDKPGAQEKRDQRVRATAGALGTTSPQ